MTITEVHSLFMVELLKSYCKMKKLSRLVKFAGAKTPTIFSKIKGKKVCDVMYHKYVTDSNSTALKIPFSQWRGTTEDEFFIFTFCGGVLTLDINEREMLLGHSDSINIIALASKIQGMNSFSYTSQDFEKKVELNIHYLKTDYLDDIENTKFSDIMKIIGWKFVRKNIKEDVFCFEY